MCLTVVLYQTMREEFSLIPKVKSDPQHLGSILETGAPVNGKSAVKIRIEAKLLLLK